MSRWLAEHPDESVSAAQHGVESGLAWNALTDAQKEPWERRAALHKAETQKEHAEWEQRKQRRQQQQLQAEVAEAEAEARRLQASRLEEADAEAATDGRGGGEDGELSPALSGRSLRRMQGEDVEDEQRGRGGEGRQSPGVSSRLLDPRAALLVPLGCCATTAYQLFRSSSVQSARQQAAAQGRKITLKAAAKVLRSHTALDAHPLSRFVNPRSMSLLRE